MTTTATMNGKPQRKQLADQIDRLDRVIASIGTELNQAVTDACREGAQAAVRSALVEVFSNPELRALLTPAAPTAVSAPTIEDPPAVSPAVPTPTGFWAVARERTTTVAGAARRRCTSAATAVRETAAALSAVMPLKRMAVIGLCVGLGVGLVAYLAPSAVAAVAAGVGGAVTAVAAQVGGWFRRSRRALGLT